MDWDFNNLRLIVFLTTLITFSVLEFFFSFRDRIETRKLRWSTNLAMIITSSLLIKLVLPSGLAYFSLISKDLGIGLFNLVQLNYFLELSLSFFLLDFLIYVQHVLSHKIIFFWRFHKVHHTDVDLDATSALRFHPIEILFSIFYKSFWIIFLGISIEAILLFEIILNSCAIFNHSNIKIPNRLEKVIRLLLVTPQMHIIHHSVEKSESDKNFGFCLSLWDHLFHTYLESFTSSGLIGQKENHLSKSKSFLFLMKLPFVKS